MVAHRLVHSNHTACLLRPVDKEIVGEDFGSPDLLHDRIESSTTWPFLQRIMSISDDWDELVFQIFALVLHSYARRHILTSSRRVTMNLMKSIICLLGLLWQVKAKVGSGPVLKLHIHRIRGAIER